MFEIIPIPAFNDNYIWCLWNPKTRLAAVVDPGDAAPVIEHFRQNELQLCAILITHHHYDHTGGINALLKRWKVPVYGPNSTNIAQISQPLAENDSIHIPELDAEFRILEIPAHTLDHIAYVGHNALFCGDTLFIAGCGRLFEGSAAQMHQALSKLAQLPAETMVYCGHEYTVNNLQFAQMVEPDNTDIAEKLKICQHKRNNSLPTVPDSLASERLTNPFLRVNSPSVMQAAEKRAGQTLKNPVQILSTIREWKNSF